MSEGKSESATDVLNRGGVGPDSFVDKGLTHVKPTITSEFVHGKEQTRISQEDLERHRLELNKATAPRGGARIPRR